MDKKMIWQKIWNAVKCIWDILWSCLRHPIQYVKTLIPRLKKAGWTERILLIGVPIGVCVLLWDVISYVLMLILGPIVLFIYFALDILGCCSNDDDDDDDDDDWLDDWYNDYWNGDY